MPAIRRVFPRLASSACRSTRTWRAHWRIWKPSSDRTPGPGKTRCRRPWLPASRAVADPVLEIVRVLDYFLERLLDQEVRVHVAPPAPAVPSYPRPPLGEINSAQSRGLAGGREII